MESVKQETLSGVKWSAIGSFSYNGIHFILGIILARLLTPDDFGAIAMLGVFIAISNTFIDSGFTQALIRKLDRTDVDYSTVFYFNFVISVLCYIVLFLLAPWVANFYKIPILCPVLRVQAITLIINSLCVIHTTQLTIAIDFKGIAMRGLYSVLISGVVGIVLAYLGLGIWALVVQGLLAEVVNMVFLWSYNKWKPLWTFSWQSFRELFSFGGKLLASGLLNTVYDNLNSLIIGKMFTARDLGYYNRGTQFARFPGNTINSILQKVTYPVMSKIQNDDEHLIRVYRKYIASTCMVIFFVTTLLAALGRPVVLLVLSDKWADAIIYLQIYCFAVMFAHINGINVNLLKVKGRSDIILRLDVIKKTISIGILFTSIPFGVIGICVSKILWVQIAIIINTYYTGKYFGLGYFEQIKDFIVFFVTSLIACLPAYLFAIVIPSNIFSLIWGLIVSPLLYWFILRNNPIMKEMLDIVVSNVPLINNKYRNE